MVALDVTFQSRELVCCCPILLQHCGQTCDAQPCSMLYTRRFTHCPKIANPDDVTLYTLRRLLLVAR